MQNVDLISHGKRVKCVLHVGVSHRERPPEIYCNSTFILEIIVRVLVLTQEVLLVHSVSSTDWLIKAWASENSKVTHFLYISAQT